MERSVFAVALRRSALLFTALLLLPAAAGAQLAPLQDDPAWGAKIRFTPFVGWAPAVDREETWRVTQPDGAPYAVVEGQLAGGPVVGATVEYAFAGRWSALAGGMFMSRDVAGFLQPDSSIVGFTSSRSLFGKAGISLQLWEPESDMRLRRLGASLFAAPFIMIDMPDAVAGVADESVFDNATHFGLNFGATGELPFANDRMAFQIGFEDYLTIWDESALSRWVQYAYGPDSAVDADASHQWVVRAGLSFRFR